MIPADSSSSSDDVLAADNQALRAEIAALRRANDELQRLVDATDVATLLLDYRGAIVRYTQPATRLFDLSPADEGRDLERVSHRLRYPVLNSDVAHVLAQQTPLHREVRDADGHTYLARLLPYPDTGGALLTFVDITERKHAKQALERNAALTRRALQDAPYPIVVHADDGTIIQLNRTWTELSGYTLNDIPRLDDWLRQAYGEDSSHVRTSIEQLYTQNRRIDEGRFIVRTKAGHRRVWAFSSSPLGVDDQGRRLVISMAADVTDQEQAEVKMQQAYSFLEATLDALSAHIAVLNDAGEIIATNRAWRHFAATHDDPYDQGIGTNYLGVCATDASSKWSREAYDGLHALIDGHAETFRMEYPCPLSTEGHWFVMRASRFEHGGQVHIAVAHEDITLRRRAEDALVEARARLEATLASVHIGTWNWQISNDRVWADEQLAQMFSVTPDEAQGGSAQAYARAVHPDDLPAVRQATRKALETGGLILVEFRLVQPDATTRWMIARGHVEHDAQGPTQMVGAVLDITERKQTSLALERSEARYRGLVESTAQAVWEIDPDGREQGSGKAWWLSVTGQTEEDAADGGWIQAVHPDDREDVRTVWQESLTQGIPFHTEYRIHAYDGRVLHLAVRGVPLPGNGGTFEWIGTFEDISARKNAEAALKALNEELEGRVAERTAALTAANADLLASEERFRLLVEGVKDYAIFLLDPEGYIVSWNAGAQKIKGYTASEAIGMHFSMFYPPDRAASGQPARALQQAQNEGQFVDEGWRVRKDGKRLWASVLITALHDDEGTLIGFSKITRDLTERKEAEHALRLSEERFARIFHKSPVAVTLLRLSDQTHLDLNGCMADLLGYTREEVLGRTSAELGVGMQDISHRTSLQEKLRREGSFRDVKTRIRRRDGHESIVILSAEMMEVEGEACALVTSLDITERELAETALRASEERFAMVFHSAPVAGMITRYSDGAFVETNEAFARVTGYCPEALEGETTQSVGFAPIGFDREEMLRLLRTEGGFRDREMYIRRPDGQPVNILASTRLLSLSGEPHILSMFYDISDRKRLEREVIEISTFEQQRIGQDLHDNLGQQLTGISFMLSTLAYGLPEPQAAQLQRITELVTQTVDQTRDLSRTLLPFDLEREGFEQALRNLVSRIESRFNIPVDLDFEGPPLHDAERSMHLYRIAQEAAHNAAKHAAPDQIRLAFTANDTDQILRITDDGCGIPDAVLSGEKGLGLNIMRYRARVLGGTLSIARSDEGGTVVTCRLPVSS